MSAVQLIIFSSKLKMNFIEYDCFKSVSCHHCDRQVAILLF